MPWTHHSHSGQFCGHATSTLEEVVQTALDKKMTTLCLTEHIPRDRVDFYPGEEKSHTPESLEQLYDSFYHEARRLQKAYQDRIQLFVGFEGEWIRSGSLRIIQRILDTYELDLFVGSVHHVHTIPIDYDTETYHAARKISGGEDEQLFCHYLDAQLEMLQALKPPVVGHFDLIRLKSDSPDTSFTAWPNVWNKVVRNLRFIATYGGVLELNSSSLRKGMREAYPQVDICKAFVDMGGRFTLSDDSHGVEHVGFNYRRVLECIKEAGITELVVLAPISPSTVQHDPRFPGVGWQGMSIAELEQESFWES